MMTTQNDISRRRNRFRAALLATTMGVTLAVGPLAAGFAPAFAQDQTQQVQAQTAVPLQSLSPIVDRVMPAVVNISVTMKNGAADEQTADDEDQGSGPVPGFPNSPFDEFLKRFFDQQGLGGQNGIPQAPHRQMGKRIALGSGFIIDPSGYVVTNNHVVGEAQDVSVVFQDNTKHPAKIIGRDEKTDLALLKIENGGKPLPYVTFGDSDQAKVGDWIMAVGNPFGLGGSVTAGIVSARGRDIHSGPFDDFLQLDAPINRGNSGGPTFNMSGQVIGINTAIYSPSGGSVGIGFAIPSNLAKRVVAELREHGKVERGWLGVQVQELTPEIAGSLGLPNKDQPKGALVAEVQPNSPAAKAGVHQGDVIVKFNGQDVEKLRDLPRLVAETPAGKSVDIEVWRDRQTQDLQTTIAALKGQDKQMAAGEQQDDQAKPEKAGALGLQLAPLDSQMRQRLHLKKDVKGVVVAGVQDDGPAAELGIQPGDVIMSINNKPVGTPKQAADALKEIQASPDKNALLLLNRRGVTQFVGLSLEPQNKG
jgi:serine protease Do